MFHNLTHMNLTFEFICFNVLCNLITLVLNNSPRFQNLAIHNDFLSFIFYSNKGLDFCELTDITTPTGSIRWCGAKDTSTGGTGGKFCKINTIQEIFKVSKIISHYSIKELFTLRLSITLSINIIKVSLIF